MCILKYLLEKEFKQFFRNKMLPKLVLMFPIMVLAIYPWVTTFEVKNITVTVVDSDNSMLSRRLSNKIKGSDYFELANVTAAYPEALEDVEKGRADVVLNIPACFEESLLTQSAPLMQISANAVNGIKGNLGSSYLNSIINDFVREVSLEKGVNPTPPVEIIVRNRYNQTLDSKKFMIPALVSIILIILCGFFPALNIVSEKETGTIEQMNVTPISRSAFIIAKLIPYIVMGFVSITIAFALAFVVYGYAPQGSFFTIYGASFLFILVISALGLVISNHSSTMLQAMLVMFFFVMFFILMSGLLTPINSMPEWAQKVARMNPPRYLINIMRSVYMKGGTIIDNLNNFVALIGFGIAFWIWAILSYRKQQ